MTNTTLDKAIAAVPKFGDRISLFTKKLRLAQYADGSIYDYRLKIAQAVLFFNKLPEEFTQTDIDYYLSTLLTKNRCSLSFFKHTVFGLQAYYKVMGLKQPNGLVLPKVRKPKRLPRVLSQEQIARLLRNCTLYDKTLLAIIYDCALRVSEACRLRWDDICFDRGSCSSSRARGARTATCPSPTRCSWYSRHIARSIRATTMSSRVIAARQSHSASLQAMCGSFSRTHLQGSHSTIPSPSTT